MPFDFNALWNNPQVMGGLMGLSNLRDPDSMGRALMAMQQMQQFNKRHALEEEQSKALNAYRTDQGRLAQTNADLRQRELDRLTARDAREREARERLQAFYDRIGFGAPQQPQAPQGMPQPERNDEPTAPVFGNEVQGQTLPPAGQPQPTHGSSPFVANPAQSSVGLDKAPPPNVVNDFFHNVIVGKLEGGTNPDGSFRTSPKGAVGPAQLMPQTAPEAARLAGLPWDENKYRTDADYNTKIGAAYFRKQVDTFGDLATGAAAYNAGPGAVLKAKNQATKMGNPAAWLSFMPEETQAYVQKGTGYSGGMIPTQLQKPALEQAQSQQMEAWRQARIAAGYAKDMFGDHPGAGLADVSEAMKPTNASPGSFQIGPNGQLFRVPDPIGEANLKLRVEEGQRAAQKNRREEELQPGAMVQQGADIARTRSQTAENIKAAEAKQQEIDTKVETEIQGHTQFDEIIKGMRKNLQELRKLGGIIDTDKGALENAVIRAKLTDAGQAAMRAAGSKEQELRDKIEQAKPLLMQAMKTASGMGVRQFDTEKELQFFLSAAGNATSSYQATEEALNRLANSYGSDSPVGKAFKNKESAKKYLENQKSSGNDMSKSNAPMSFEDARKLYGGGR